MSENIRNKNNFLSKFFISCQSRKIDSPLRRNVPSVIRWECHVNYSAKPVWSITLTHILYPKQTPKLIFADDCLVPLAAEFTFNSYPRTLPYVPLWKTLPLWWWRNIALVCKQVCIYLMHPASHKNKIYFIFNLPVRNTHANKDAIYN